MSVRDIVEVGLQDNRNEDLKLYQRQRAAKRRARGLVSRTVWIRQVDEDLFRDQVAALVEHARLIEAVTGGPELSAVEISEIVTRHELPYDASELVFLSRIREAIVLDPSARNAIEQRAQGILDRYRLPVSLEELLD